MAERLLIIYILIREGAKAIRYLHIEFCKPSYKKITEKRLSPILFLKFL